MKPYSLTRRMIATVLLIQLAAALCVITVAFFYERHAHFRAFDVRLRGRADSVLGAVQDADDADDNVMLDGTQAASPPEDVYEVQDSSGRLLGRSANWPGSQDLTIEDHHKHSDLRHASPFDMETFAHVSIHGVPYRVVRIEGVRVVDPGEKGGAIRRYVTVYYGSPVTRVWRAVVSAVGFYAVSSILVLAVTGILLSWLLKRELAPLLALAAAAGEVSASSWTFSPNSDVRRTRELAPLVVALESLIAGLKQSFEQQRRFVGDAAHELKTGVALVKSSLQLMGMKPRTPAEYQAGIDRSLDDCARMEELVFQMLTLARIEEAPQPDPALPVTDLDSAIARAAEQVQSAAQIRAISICIESADPSAHESLFARIEAEQLKLLCSNVLMNAIQHCPPASAIRIRIRQAGSHAEIEFRDPGDGIDAEDLPYIFDRFSRGDPSRSRNTGGAGLGLAICKAIVDRAGGSIQVQSTRHVGTVVTVCLPLAEQPSPSVIQVL